MENFLTQEIEKGKEKKCQKTLKFCRARNAHLKKSLKNSENEEEK